MGAQGACPTQMASPGPGGAVLSLRWPFIMAVAMLGLALPPG